MSSYKLLENRNSVYKRRSAFICKWIFYNFVIELIEYRKQLQFCEGIFKFYQDDRNLNKCNCIPVIYLEFHPVKWFMIVFHKYNFYNNKINMPFVNFVLNLIVYFNTISAYASQNILVLGMLKVHHLRNHLANSDNPF